MRGYRYDIHTEPVPDRYLTPNKFTPHIEKRGLFFHLLKETLHQRFDWPVIFSRPCIYGTLSRPVGGFAPVKDKCVACHRCVQEYDFVRITFNPQYEALGDSYFDPDTLATVVSEAATGEIPVKGMGYKGKFVGEGFDSFWTDMSEIVRPTRDGIYGREYISTAVDIGRKAPYFSRNGRHGNFVQIPIPILLDYIPEGLTTHTINAVLAEASRRLGTYALFSLQDCLERDLPPNHVVPLISQRDIHEYGDRIKDFRILEFRPDGFNLESLKSGIRGLKRINPSAILTLRVEPSSSIEPLVLDLVEDVDIFHFCADYHGKSAWNGEEVRVKDLTMRCHQKLVDKGVRDEVTLFVSGGIIRAEHVPKAIICGADAVGLDTAVLVALQSKFTGECISDTPGNLQPRKIGKDWGVQRVMNLLASWRNQLLEVLSAMGIRDVRRLRGEHGRAIFYEELIKRIPVFDPNAE